MSNEHSKVMQERIKFESWFRSISPEIITDVVFLRQKDGKYRYTSVNLCWEAWKAAISGKN